MLAKLIPFCICALVGIKEVTAQLDFGKYNIVNRASQSTLCSHPAGGPLYVSTRGYPCARELWELGPGDDHGSYTIKNVGLNSYVRANKLSGSVVTSNRTTSFTMSSAEGIDHIIKFPNTNLAWTVVPTNVSRSDILLQPESGNDTQLWTLIRIDGLSGYQPFADFSVQTRYSKEEERNLAFLRGIEKLGGSAGYQKYLELPRTTPNATHISTLTTNTLSKTSYASGSLVSFVIYTLIEVTVGEYTGQGTAWGPGIGGMGFIGTLFYNSWDELLSTKNGISIVGGGVGGNGVVIIFSVNGNDVAVLTVAGLGAGVLLGDRGSFVWTRNGQNTTR